MRIDVVTIFPEMFPSVLGQSIVQRAQERGVVRINVVNLRDYTHDRRRTVDDRPYGGGPGMVMKPEPIFEAVEAIKRACGVEHAPGACQTLLMSPQGQRWTSALAKSTAMAQHLILLCGHYEGVDERVRGSLVTQEISIGDYVLTGGELPAMVVIDSVARFLPGVIGHQDATVEESFEGGMLEYPHYTRPPVFRSLVVPEVLRSGDHQRIAMWRKAKAVTKTRQMRPDLLRSTNGAQLQK